MKELRGFIVGLILAIGLTSVHAVTTNAGLLTTSAEQICIEVGNKNMVVNLPYSFTSSGNFLDRRLIRLPGDNTAVTDLTGATVVATVPVAVSTARDSLITAVQAAVTAGGNTGKLDR